MIGREAIAGEGVPRAGRWRLRGEGTAAAGVPWIWGRGGGAWGRVARPGGQSRSREGRRRWRGGRGRGGGGWREAGTLAEVRRRGCLGGCVGGLEIGGWVKDGEHEEGKPVLWKPCGGCRLFQPKPAHNPPMDSARAHSALPP